MRRGRSNGPRHSMPHAVEKKKKKVSKLNDPFERFGIDAMRGLAKTVTNLISASVDTEPGVT